MDIYIARQPILNAQQEVCAYELLYRSNEQNRFMDVEGEHATSDVMNSILQIGLDELSEGKPCFINFTEKLLEFITPAYLHPENMVIEVLETVNPTDKVIKNCQKLKEMGYTLALDDFEMRLEGPNFSKLLELADIIKVDIRKTPREEQLRIIRHLKPYNLVFLAEKVETREEYEQCLRDGYIYFQGYFFSKPVILSSSDVPTQRQAIIVVMNELTKDEPDIDQITKLIEADLSLSYKLLKLINSALVGPVKKIKSIKQAIVFLGLKELRKWMYVLSFRETTKIVDPVIQEVIKMAFMRAKLSELIAVESGRRKDSASYFLIGMLSLMDTLLKRPLDQILQPLPLEQDIKNTLLGIDTSYSDIYQLIQAVEQAEWLKIESVSKAIGINQQKLFQLYQEAMKWANEMVVDSEALESLD